MSATFDCGVNAGYNICTVINAIFIEEDAQIMRSEKANKLAHPRLIKPVVANEDVV